LAGRDFEETMVSNDLIRRYHLHLPSNDEASNSLPLLMALHGRLGTGKKMIKQTGFNGCKKSPEVQEIHGLNGETVVSVFTYSTCQDRTKVKLYRIEGGVHVWPGEAEGLPKSSFSELRSEIDASEEIWKFFESTMN
jgi:poly(3-hydroxybutyrate) depolymerase